MGLRTLFVDKKITENVREPVANRGGCASGKIMQRTAPTSERKGPQSKQRNAAVFLQVDVASQIKTALNPYNGRSNRNQSGFFGKKSHKLGARSEVPTELATKFFEKSRPMGADS